MERFQGLIGIVVILMIAYVFSNNKKNINSLYKVRTVTLNDIFCENNLLSVDFLSIDTDGTEYEIVKNFDFRKFKVKILVIEHNYQSFKIGRAHV